MKIFKEIEEVIDYVEEFVDHLNIDDILDKFNKLKYIIPVPTNWERCSLEDWFDLNDDAEMHWIIPSKDMIRHILGYKIIDMYYFDDFENEIADIKIKLEEKNIIIDLSNLDKQIEELEEMTKEWQYDHDNVLPNKPYVGNCSKEFCEKIVEKYWEREYERIQYIDFPPLSFKHPTIKKCEDEFKKLKKENINKLMLVSLCLHMKVGDLYKKMKKFLKTSIETD